MSKNADTPPDEFALIAQIFAPLAAGDPGSFGLTDDAAIISSRAGQDLVVTADMMTAGVHFFADDAPDLIARKLLRVNLSDLAAKGAKPHGYILTVALPVDTGMPWLRAFAEGLARDQAEFGINLLGGDTTAAQGPLCLSVTATGWVGQGGMLRRSGAQAGDDIYVSGTIGDAGLGLRVRRDGPLAGLSAEQNEFLLGRYLLPQPRNQLGVALAGAAHACLDVSDGLAADLGHITGTSRVGAEIQLLDIPLSRAAKTALDLKLADITELIGAGDDYELLFTAPPAQAQALRKIAAAANVAICRIGRIIAGSGVVFLDQANAPVTLKKSGYRHF
ncbi:MAG TPA: thiamine-phosphate kinase [Alphaproteobacteria bacterium]|nr:thiamine-phosphate kinase [Alphaproteobacteria bacterium]